MSCILDILGSASVGSTQLTELKLSLWTYDLLQVLVVCIKQDFTKVPGGYTTGSQLAQILR